MVRRIIAFTSWLTSAESKMNRFSAFRPFRLLVLVLTRFAPLARGSALSLAFSEHYFIQMEPDLQNLMRVSGAWITAVPRLLYLLTGFFDDFLIAAPLHKQLLHHLFQMARLALEHTTATMMKTMDNW